MNILGLSAFYHESACCLLQDGLLIAAASEERFSRIKHDPRLPVGAFSFCLKEGGLSVADLDCVAYYEVPVDKLARQLWAGVPANNDRDLPWLDPRLPERMIRDRLGYSGPLRFYPHHLSHGASSYFYSGFPDAAILTVDGVGEWTTQAYFEGVGPDISKLEEVRFPHSLGLLYSTVTSYLGFKVNGGEYKVMGLAAYGRPCYEGLLRGLLRSGLNGQFELDLRYFDFIQGRRMFSPQFVELVGFPPREPESQVQDFHCDLASSLQVVLEEILLDKVRYLASRVKSRNLCLAGGVALNSVANGKIVREGPFERVFIQPAAGDSGACLGAAALALRDLEGGLPQPLQHVYLGPAWGQEEINALLKACGLRAHDFGDDLDALAKAVVHRLEKGWVVGWVQGRMEFGPRALGARSILADPRREGIKERLNLEIKKRESFRPFAPSVLEDRAADYFELADSSNFMLQTCQVRPGFDLPAITHQDGSARPQTVSQDHNPEFFRLLELFYERTGCPVLLNTSLNFRGEPIACSPADALRSFVQCNLDSIAIGHRLIDREDVSEEWLRLVHQWPRQRFQASSAAAAIPNDLYTFV